MFSKNKFAMLLSEFLGTAVLTLAVLSVSKSIGYPFFVSFAAGLTIILMTLALGNISGAIFNPAMTIGLWTVRKIRSLQAIVYLVVQLLGGWVAYLLFFKFFVKVPVSSTQAAFDSHVLVAEAIGAFIFAFGWAAAIYQKFNVYAKAITIGGAFALGIIVASLGSSGLINPAVALGTHSWDLLGSMGWGTYVLGPVLGGVIGFNLYNLLFVETEVAEAKVAKVTAPKAVAVKPARKVVAKKSTKKTTRRAK
ncbi:MAG: aquaporin [Candidatus Saccharimonadales bacterium]